MRRLIVAASIGTLVLGSATADAKVNNQSVGPTTPPPAAASYEQVDYGAGVQVAYAGEPSTVPGRPTQRWSGPVVVCTLSPIMNSASGVPIPGTVDTAHEGTWYFRICQHSTAGTITGPHSITAIRYQGSIAGDGLVDIAAVAEHARNQLTVPPPATDWAPPATLNVVGLQTWIGATTPDPITTTATAGPLWAQATATAKHITIDFGDDTEPLTCPLPVAVMNPRADQGPDCLTHTYHHASSTRDEPDATHTATATITYDITITTGETLTDTTTAPTPVDTITGPAETTNVRVVQLQAVLR